MSETSFSMEPNKGPNVKVIADIAAPIEKKAMTEAKIFLLQLRLLVLGPRPLPEGT